jgi:Flp pilus assembly protein TadB
MMTFCMLLSFNANAGVNSDNFTPKTEISDVRKSKKAKTIQRFLNTKIGKWVIKKTLKNLQKQALNPQKNKNKRNPSTGAILITIFALILLGGIVLLFLGYIVLGVILTVIGLLLLALSFFILGLVNPDNWRRVRS